ncbi:type 1 glutamine amidotransferase [Leucobacter sp. wl10]|nr:type 1 glutamine amidotransferase [Leucobacter sp. wl10]
MLVVEHQGNAGLGQLSDRLTRSGLRLDTVGPDAGASVPDSLDGYDALIVLGGATGPTDDDAAPWLPATRRLLAGGAELGVPTLGICLGAQLLATATGGRVRAMPDGPEVGLCDVDFGSAAATDPLFSGLAGRSAPAVQWHWLEADRLPAGARVLASSPACRNQAFRIGDAAWGVQFHLEALGATAQDWVDEDRRSLDELGLDGAALVREVRDAEPRLGAVWLPIADRFADIAKRPAGRPDQPTAR